MRQKMAKHIATVVIFTMMSAASLAQARDRLQIVGSSTVLPYAKIVAEAFGETWDHFKTPVIESGGTGAGIKEFCRGIGVARVDIINASRPMKRSELQSCFDAGVSQVQEIRFGYDALVFANLAHESAHEPNWHFRPRDIYQALAAQIVVDGKLIANPIKLWHEIDPTFPKFEISLYIPGEKHGSREILEEKLMVAGCKESGAFDALKNMGLNDKATLFACIAVRKDGRAVDIDGDYAEMLARISSDKGGIGVFALSFYENNADRLQLASISDVFPTVKNVAAGDYPLARPLFFYVKRAHLDLILGLREYVDFFLSNQMSHADGPLADYGLITLPEEERAAQARDFASGVIMKQEHALP